VRTSESSLDFSLDKRPRIKVRSLVKPGLVALRTVLLQRSCWEGSPCLASPNLCASWAACNPRMRCTNSIRVASTQCYCTRIQTPMGFRFPATSFPSTFADPLLSPMSGLSTPVKCPSLRWASSEKLYKYLAFLLIILAPFQILGGVPVWCWQQTL
jgi:hypothetical protein